MTASSLIFRQAEEIKIETLMCKFRRQVNFSVRKCKPQICITSRVTIGRENSNKNRARLPGMCDVHTLHDMYYELLPPLVYFLLPV